MPPLKHNNEMDLGTVAFHRLFVRMLTIRSCRSSKRDRKNHRLRAQAAKRYSLADVTPALAARSHTHARPGRCISPAEGQQQETKEL